MNRTSEASTRAPLAACPPVAHGRAIRQCGARAGKSPAAHIRLIRGLTLAACGAAMCAAAGAVEIELTRLDGETARGELLQVTPEITIATSDDELSFTWAETLALTPLGEKPEPTPAGPLRFNLTDGSSFSGKLESAAEHGVLVRLASGQDCRVELSLLQAIRSTNPGPVIRDKLRAVADDAQRAEDVAVVQRGEKAIVLRGVVRELAPKYVLMTWNERDLRLQWRRVAGLFLARRPGVSARHAVRLVGGDVFAGVVTGGDAEGVVLRSESYEALMLPWSRIERIDCRGRHLTYLSDLEPVRYEFTPFFQKRWDYARDATLSGRSIRLNGREYRKGVTMHSRSELAFAIDGAYRKFAARVGVVDEMGGRGAVAVSAVGDGRVLWEADDIRGGQPPREVLIDIGGVRELSLHVDFGDGLDLSDHVSWAQARLIK